MNRLHLNLVVVVSLVLPRPFGVAAAQVEYTFTTLAGSAGSAGSANGVGGAARFNNPEGVVVDSAGNVFVADRENKTIRKITPGGVVSTFAGSLGISAVVDGSATAARFDRPSGMAVDSTGNLFVSDSQTIRRITPGGVVSTLAGLSGNRGSVDGTGTAARFAFPQGVAVDSVGNIYVADWENHTIRKITPARVVSTLAGMTGSIGSANGTRNVARFQNPVGVAVDNADNLYVTDSGNRTVRKITPSGVVSTLAGLAGSFGTADGPGSVARFGRPIGVAVDSAGNVFVTDQINETIRKITPDGVVSTLAGSAGNIGSANGRGSAARFNLLGGVAVDSAGNLYVADIGNNTIRKGTPEAVGPPSITTQPQNQTVAAGTDATLRVDAFGTTPLAYQWLLNSVALVGQTNATLTLGKALPVHSGVYKVAVRNSLGTLESQAAQVTVEWQARFDRVGSSDFPDLLARSVAVGDFDNDGLEDLFFANSSGASRLYRNLGSGQFAVVSPDMLSGSASGRRSGVWADYDNDGNLDLFVIRLKLAGRNLLFMNRGDGSFEEVGVQAGLGHIGDSYAAAWGDYDRDGFVDLFVANGENQNNLLYRNRGDGTFEQITAGPIVNDAGNSTGASWGDYDGDGWPDLAVSNQLLPSGDGRLFLYRNNRDGTFGRVTENPVVNTLGDSWGVSWADTDRDGDLDLLVVNDSGESDYLLRNDGKNNFTRIEAGSLTRDARDGLAGLWGDYNNDGLLDALVTGFGGGPDQLHRGLGGNSFTNVTSLGSASTSIGGFGAAWFDLEGDGDLDSVITSSDVLDVTRLGRNSGNNAAWLRVKLEGRVSNRSAIGAVVRVRAVVDGETVTQMRQVEGGSGVSSQNSLIAHFGLSDAGVVESLRVEWPSGMITERTNVPVRQLLLMEELPLGAPVVRVNGRFDPSNRHEFVTREPVEIKLQSSFSNAQIFYTLDSSAPDAASAPYGGPFRVTPPAVVRAIAYKGDFTAETQGEPVHLVFLETYQVTDVTPGGGGVILNPAGGSYLSNSIVSVTATPLAGWAFLRWEGSVTGTNPVATLRVDGPKSVQAVFGTLVTVTAVGGAANGSATVQPATGPLPYGSAARLSAIAAPGKYFLRWNLVGVNDTTLTNSPLNFVITNASPAFTALFGTLSAGNFALNLQVDGAGSVTKSPALAQYPGSSTVTLAAEPAPGSAFTGWSEDASGNQSPLAVTINASKTIQANFAVRPSLTTQPESQTVDAGATVNFRVNATGTPPLSFQWRKDGADLLEATNATHTMANVQTNRVGSYSVVISNKAGSVESAAASLSVSIYTFITFAGVAGSGSADGSGRAARFFNPGGVSVDSAGNAYVADSSNHTIRKITPAGEVSTLAGLAGAAGNLDGTGSAARFDQPQGTAVDSAGNVYVADASANTIRKITPGGVVGTLAGSPYNAGSNDGPGSEARFYYPNSVAVDSAGNVYVADSSNYTVRKITPAGMVSTLAGSAGIEGDANGAGNIARLSRPNGLAVDNLGNVFVADTVNHVIRKITSGGVVSTLAGVIGNPGTEDGAKETAQFNGPTGVAVDKSGNVYVADYWSSIIRKIDPGGVVSTLAGFAYVTGSTDGTGNTARFDEPSGLAVDSAGNVFVADHNNHAIRKISPLGTVTTFAGLAGSGGADGTGSAARFYRPHGVAADSVGSIFVADSGNHTIRKITPGGLVSTLAGLAGASGDSDGTGNAARFESPGSTAVDTAGNIYVAEYSKHAIRKITVDGVVIMFAGAAWSAGRADGIGNAAQFNYPSGVAVDSAGNVFVADSLNHTIRKITPGGAVTTLAGSAETPGSADGIGSAARFNTPAGVAVDSAGNIYVADSAYETSTIRKITPDGIVSTLAGLAGNAGWADGTGGEARFYAPSGVAVDGAGTLFVSEADAHTIRKITPGGVVSTLAGSTGKRGSADGTWNAARFDFPSGVAVDKVGNLYVADLNNNTIRMGTQIVVSPQFVTPGSKDQAVTFGALPNRTFGDPPFELTATASSSLPVAFSVLSGPARLTNSLVYLTGSGTVVVRASQPGDASFNAASPLNQSFNVSEPLAQSFTDNQGAVVTLSLLAANVQGLEYAVKTAPAGGEASIGNGVITYLPRLSFYGNDSFVYTVGDPVSGAVTPVLVNLTVNPPAPLFWIAQANYDVAEGINAVNITVFKNISLAATVDFTTVSGSAGPVVNGVGDYTHTTGTLSFGSGETNKLVSIPINDDNARELDEFFAFQIYNPSSGVLGSPATAQIRIIDNDAATGDLLFTDIRYPNPRPLSVGRLRLDLWPPDSGGLWRFAGQQQWHFSGEIVEGLPDGVYSVEFNGAAGGYIQPVPLEISLIGGGPVTTNIYYIGTAPRTGSLIVNLSPASVANAPVITQRGQWRRKGELTWRDSGFLQANLNEGPHVIEFKPAEGYAKPPDRTVLVAAKTTLVNFAAYALAEIAPGLPPAVVHPSSIDLANFPYAFNGQIATEAGQGSGFVVKERVVLTAAHVVYDDNKFDFAKQVRWLFQRYKGFHEPKGEKPRGWYVSDSYSSQRKLENTPGVSSPRAKNVDVAALYFTGPAGRGGFGGYLASDADNNEWLVTGASGPRLKMLVGYPIDNIADADQGKLHATGVAPINFTQVFQRVYKTTEIKSYGGNSGGPLCVEYNGRYYPAAIYLGGSGQLDVRAIDSLVVDLINRAEVSGNGGENNTSGGVITFAPVLTDTVTGFGYLTVQMEPTEAVNAGAGWRIVGGNPAFVRSAVANLPLVDGDYNLEFADASGYAKPPISPVQIFPGTNTTFLARYESNNKAMLTLDLAGGLRLQGNRGAIFRVESKSSLDPAQPWETFVTITLTNEVQVIPGFQSQASATRFFRAVLLKP